MTANLRAALMAACGDVRIHFRDVPADGRWHSTEGEGGAGNGRIKLFPDVEGGLVVNTNGRRRGFFALDVRSLSGAKRTALVRRRREAVTRANKAEAGPGRSQTSVAIKSDADRICETDFEPDRPGGATDFNDLAALRGLDAGRRAIEGAQVASLPTGEDAPGGEPGRNTEKQAEGKAAPSTAQVLISIACEACDLFHDERGDGYAVTTDNRIRRTLRLRGRDFRRWLCGRYYGKTGKAANGEAVASALGVHEAKATFDGKGLTLHNRFACVDDALYIDLCDAAWRAVRVTADGWELLDKPPVLFRRYAHQTPLPDPVRGGRLEEVHDFLNVRHDADRRLVEAWLVSAPFERIPRPAITLHGPKGAAKTTAARALKALTDPSGTDSVDLGRDPGALAQLLDHNAVPCFDNLTNVPTWAADMLCRGVTGGAFTKRMLYTDDEDILLTFRRAMIVTGINIPTNAPDLLDRMLLIELEPITADRRKDEAAFWTRFDAARPRLFGALLDAVAGTMRHLPAVRADRLPRMADFARIACAYAEYAGLGADAMLATIFDHAGRQTEEVIESDAVAAALRDFVTKKGTWTGTAGELLKELTGPRRPKVDGWPKSPEAIGRRLKILQPTLAEIGIVTTHGHSTDTHRRRLITLAVRESEQPSKPSEPSKHSNGGTLRTDSSPDSSARTTHEPSGLEANNGGPPDSRDSSDSSLRSLLLTPGCTQPACDQQRWRCSDGRS